VLVEGVLSHRTEHSGAEQDVRVGAQRASCRPGTLAHHEPTSETRERHWAIRCRAVTLPPLPQDDPLERELKRLKRYANSFLEGQWHLHEPAVYLDNVKTLLDEAVAATELNVRQARVSTASEGAFLAALGSALDTREGTGVVTETEYLLTAIKKDTEKFDPQTVHQAASLTALDAAQSGAAPTDDECIELCAWTVVWVAALTQD